MWECSLCLSSGAGPDKAVYFQYERVGVLCAVLCALVLWSGGSVDWPSERGWDEVRSCCL